MSPCFLLYFINGYILIFSSLILVCGGYKYNENGTIRFPSGTQQGIGSSVQGMDCSYRISTTSGKVMNITFTEMRLRGPASYCPYDWVKVRFK